MSVKRCILRFFAIVLFVLGMQSVAMALDSAITPEFTIETINMSAGSTFSFDISASGTFYVDCGDGGTLSGTGVSGNTITRNDTTNAQYTCTYPNSGTHKILFAGDATGYTTSLAAAISFIGNKNIKTVDGSLGAIFSGSASSMFNSTFAGCTSLTSIPENLFAGVNGSAKRMFYSTFEYCTSLTSIPENLVSGVSGSASYMFYATFDGCTGLRGYIPYNTFPGSDVLSVSTMYDTFNNTTLATTCPAGTEQYITGFESTWDGKVACVGAVKLHVGENSAMQLSSVRPESSPVMVFDVDGKTYYAQLSDTEKTINTDTNTKYHVLYNDKEYWLHDYTVQ